MAIVNVDKFNLVIFKNKLSELLNKFQEFEEIDFRFYDLNLEKYNSIDKKDIEEKLYILEETYKKLEKIYSESIFSSLNKTKKSFSYIDLEKYVLSLNIMELTNNINNLFLEKDKLFKKNDDILNEITEYKKWLNLDFTSKDYEKIYLFDINVGSMSIKNFEKFEKEIEKLYFKIINKTKKEIQFLLISEKEFNISDKLSLYNFSKLKLDISRPVLDIIKEKENEIAMNLSKIDEINIKLEKLYKKKEDIAISIDYYKNILLKENTKEIFNTSEKLLIISGYIPNLRKEEFVEILSKVNNNYYYLEFEKIDVESKDIPIKLKNNSFVEPFETLVSTYSLPKYNEIDPSLLVAPFFCLFFGMMMADIGYGLVIFLGSIISLFLLKLEKSQRNMAKFMLFLSFSTIFWGLIYGSFFGFDFLNPFKLYSPTLDYRPVMVLSFILGIIHIFISLAVKGYILIKNKKYKDFVYDVLFWIFVLISTGYFIYAKSQNIYNIYFLISKYVMIVSMILIIATGGRDSKTKAGKLGMGLYALYGISSYMGDLISYVRLMALGLSGGFIAYAINLIASMVGKSGFMLIFSIIILILGHGFNLFLSILGSYVHTSRLIYVEFFSKFYEGGGKAFKDFKIKEKYINIKR